MLEKVVRGGTNTPIILTDLENKKVIVKQYGFEPKENSKVSRIYKKKFKTLFNDFQETRGIVEAQLIRIPKVLHVKYVKDSSTYLEALSGKETSENTTCRLVIIENYCGVSYRDICRINNNAPYIDKLSSSIEDAISKLPVNIELDTNPSNFTVLNDEIYFVDFMPPKITSYQNVPEFISLFPQIELRNEEREIRRVRRYTTLSGRIERFRYYKALLLNPQPNNTNQP